MDKQSIRIAIIITVVALLWLASGLIFPTSKKNQNGYEAVKETADLFKVEVTTIKAGPKTFSMQQLGITQANRSVDFIAETSGAVAEMLVKKGDIIKAGQPLLQIKPGNRNAELKRLEALVRQRSQEFEAAKKLLRRGHQGRIPTAAAETAYQDALSAFNQLKLDIEKTTPKAAFDCIVQRLFVQKGQFVSTGDPLVSLVELDPVIVVLKMSERDIGKIKDDSNVQFIIDFDNPNPQKIIDGQISFISPTSDANTRTFDVEVKIPNADLSIKQGQTVNAILQLETVNAFEIPASSMTLGDDGVIGIKIVDAENNALFKPITIIDQSSASFWILPVDDQDEIKLITLGQEFVDSGQKIEPVMKNKEQ